MLNFCDFIQVYVFTTNHHLNILFIARWPPTWEIAVHMAAADDSFAGN